VLLHVQHRSIQQLNENGNIPWSTVFSQQIDTINQDLIDLLRNFVEQEDEVSDDDEDSQGEIEEEDHYEEYRYDWMHLAEMGLNTKINSNSDLGTRDMDRNHNWTTDAQQNYSNDDIANVSDFMRQASINGQNKAKEKDNDSVNYQQLNEN